MKKQIFLTVMAFFLCLYSVNPISIFVFNETDLINLEPVAEDPDNQSLVFSYSPPLNAVGKWKTDYGDSGMYNVTISVSDGELSDSEKVLLVINRKEEAPSLDSHSPNAGFIEINEGTRVNFRIRASDLNKDKISYIWQVDDNLFEGDNRFTYFADYNSAGEHKVKVIATDGIFNTTLLWNVRVHDVDIDAMLRAIPDMNVTETDTVRLRLPNFKKLGLSYNITSPLEKNKWKTTYEDSGIYDFFIDVWGNGYVGSEKVEVIVNNKDRLPVFENKAFYFVTENELFELLINATDPDGERVSYSIEDMPKGSDFANNVFKWKPTYDYVNKNNVLDIILDKFHILGRIVSLKTEAITASGSKIKDIFLIVKDNNRPFEINDFEDIYVNEGDTVWINPEYYDPDNDSVSFSYSGWMDKNNKKTGYDDAGTYFVKVTGRNDYHEAYKFVKIIVRDSNRPPFLERIDNYEIYENDSLEILLNAYDEDYYDKDSIIYSGRNFPEGSYIKENKFYWTPSFDSVGSSDEKKDFVVYFSAGDGKSESEVNVTISVFNKNRAPEIINASERESFLVKEKALFWVNAKDPDGDSLSYLWDFGIFEKYNATAIHERIFSYSARKTVKVSVSDGKDSVLYEWDVNVGSLKSTISEKKETVVKETEEKAVNNPPRIINVSRETFTYVNVPITLWAAAIDPDNDALSYEWDFGVFDNYKGSNSIQRIFKSAGVKTVKIRVSDGSSIVSYTWRINVLKPALEKQPVETYEPEVIETVEPPKGSLYDQYTIEQINGEIVSEKKESFIVY